MTDQLATPLIGIIVTALLSLFSLDAVKKGLGDLFGKLPKQTQWLPPLLLAMAGTAGEGFLSGKTGEDLFYYAAGSGAEAGALAIAFWHIIKRFKSAAVASSTALLLVGLLGFGHFACSRDAVDNQIDKALLFEHKVMGQVGYLNTVFETVLAAPGFPEEKKQEARQKFADGMAWLTECMQAKDSALLAAKQANAETIDVNKLVEAIVGAVQRIIGVVAWAGANPLLVEDQQAKALTLSRGI